LCSFSPLSPALPCDPFIENHSNLKKFVLSKKKIKNISIFYDHFAFFGCLLSEAPKGLTDFCDFFFLSFNETFLRQKEAVIEPG
jgi:hypothetical protein